MDILGITFDRELKEYIAVKSIKISKWIDHVDLSSDIIFRLSIEHNYRKNEFRKLREFYIYFKKEDLDNIEIKENILGSDRNELRKKISPLRELENHISMKRVEIERNKEKKRIKVVLDDYSISQQTKRQTIKLLLSFRKESITILSTVEPSENPPWFYDCLIEPYLVQTQKWSKKEFMPPIEYLEIWLQIPQKLYVSLFAINVQPVREFEQMFLLGEKFAKDFQEAGQPLAEKDTLCISWAFSNIGISSPPEEIEVTCGLRQFTEEKGFVKRFMSQENPILILREILYTCKVKTLDFNYIISEISDQNLIEVLKIFNVMVFQKYTKSMKENLNLLIPRLQYFRYLPYGEEFFKRYYIFLSLISCEKPEDFFSGQLLFMLKQIQKLEDVLDPDYIILMQDLSNLIETTRRTRYKEEILSAIEIQYHKWTQRLVNPDRSILASIFFTWKSIIEREYEEMVPLPKIKAVIKTDCLAFLDKVGFVLSISNNGTGAAKDIYARIVQADSCDIITAKSEVKPYLAGGGGPFEPGLVVKPGNVMGTDILYEIRYKDIMGREARNEFTGTISFIMKDIPFQKIENPYIIGEIVREDKMFYGREELVRDIVDNFKGKFEINPIFLYGQRRTGKTSILFHLKKRLKENSSPVFFSTLEIFGRNSFYEDLMKKIKNELGISGIEIPNIEHDPFNLFKNQFHAKLKPKLGGRDIILIIDEYQRIDELITEGYYDDSVIDFLKAVVQDGEIRVILAGFLLPEELQNRKWMELMRFFARMDVSFLRRKDAVSLVCKPVKGLVEYDEGGIEKILSLSGCHPYFVQLICHTMVEYHNHEKVSLLGYNSVAEHLFDYFEKGYNVLQNIIFAQTQETERRILFWMQKLMEENGSISIHRSELEKCLEQHEKGRRKLELGKTLSNLERKEVIRKCTDHPDYYEFTIDLYRHWIKWNLQEK